MAWTDSCKIEAVKQVDHKVEQGMSVREALKAVSAESDIPQGTLKRWKYPEKSVPKNGNACKKPLTEEDFNENVIKRLERIIDHICNDHPGDTRSTLSTIFMAAFRLHCTFEVTAEKCGYTKEDIEELRSQVMQSLVQEHLGDAE